MENKKEMTIEVLTTINTQISDLLATLKDFEGVDITEAKKALKTAGKRISEYYYRYEQVEPILKPVSDEKK